MRTGWHWVRAVGVLTVAADTAEVVARTAATRTVNLNMVKDRW